MRTVDHSTSVLSYSTWTFPFREIMEEVLGDVNLAELTEDAPVVTREGDQGLAWHAHYYDAVENTAPGRALLALYQEFIHDWVAPLYDEPLVYQRRPSFRVSVPGNLAVGKFHTDGDFGHAPHEYNWWLPFGDTLENNTVWLGEEAVARPAVLRYGQIMTFNAVSLPHGNRLNDTGRSRVSWDFRVVPRSEWDPTAYTATAINTGLRFDIGPDAYFEEMK